MCSERLDRLQRHVARHKVYFSVGAPGGRRARRAGVTDLAPAQGSLSDRMSWWPERAASRPRKIKILEVRQSIHPLIQSNRESIVEYHASALSRRSESN